MTGTELAIKLGFIVSKNGRVFLNDKEYTSSTYNKKALSFTFRNNGKKFQAYTGKIQAYQIITQMGIVLMYLMII